MFSVLKVIVEKQRPLMERFREIEARNGMVIVTVPCDMQSYLGQIEMRRLAWCIQEELCEACFEAMAPIPRSEKIFEEVIDALHFLAEFLIVTGYDQKPFYNSESFEFVGFLEVMVDLGMAINLLKNKPWKQTLKEFDDVHFHLRFGKFIYGLDHVIRAMGLNDEELMRFYESKHKENVRRIESGV
jgi:hypothetical protein